MAICTVSEVLVGRCNRLADNGLVCVGNSFVVKNVIMDLCKACKSWETLKPAVITVGKGLRSLNQGRWSIYMMLSMALVRLSKSFFSTASQRASMSFTGTSPDISSRALGVICPSAP